MYTFFIIYHINHLINGSKMLIFVYNNDMIMHVRKHKMGFLYNIKIKKQLI